MSRPDGRHQADLRPVSFEIDVQKGVAGSVMITWGDTRVLCSASIQDKAPAHTHGTGRGWLTAEYSMLPGAGNSRIRRDRGGKLSGRTAEIQRLIGRSLRAVVDLKQLDRHTMWIDCDVIQADGGTRCASITGAYIAACLALGRRASKAGRGIVLPAPLAAVSVGIVAGKVVSDLCYLEDRDADVDLNFVACESGIVEVQGTAEGAPFGRDALGQMLDLGEAATASLFRLQRQTLEAAGLRLPASK